METDNVTEFSVVINERTFLGVHFGVKTLSMLKPTLYKLLVYHLIWIKSE